MLIFRQINVFTSEVTKELISRIFLGWWRFVVLFHTVNTRTVWKLRFCRKNSVKSNSYLRINFALDWFDEFFLRLWISRFFTLWQNEPDSKYFQSEILSGAYVSNIIMWKNKDFTLNRKDFDKGKLQLISWNFSKIPRESNFSQFPHCGGAFPHIDF